MARIPTYVSDETIRGSIGAAPLPLATPDDFGASIGKAQQGTGAAMIGAGVQLGSLAGELKRKQEKLDEANAVANHDFTKEFADLKMKAAADPTDFQQTVNNAYRDNVDKYVNGLDVGESTRAQVKTRLMSSLPSYMGAAQSFETATKDAFDKNATNRGLSTIANKVVDDASEATFDNAVKTSNELIDAQPGILQVNKEIMKTKNVQDLANRRFQGLINATKDDPTALEGVKTDLKSGRWDTRLDDKDKVELLNKVEYKLSAANTAEASAGRTALHALSQRDEAGVAMDPAELSGVKDAVLKSGRPELISQFAMLSARQDIFRNGKDLPPAEQRAQFDKAMKAGGISALPAPVRDGIAAGVKATNGAIKAEFLAGLVNAEYGHLVDKGDYTKGTANGMSDAAGISQFTGSTFLATVKAHATQLGIAPGMSDAQILALRADPGIAIPAAALHAQDNKTILEGALGRPVTDGDLYFAHLLGTNGSKRFLTAADANPKGIAKDNVAPEQVAANLPVFLDSNTGKPRTNEQVRYFVTHEMMNGPSRVDFASAKAWQKVMTTREAAMKDDPMTFARTTHQFADIGDISKPDGMARRGVVAGQIAEFYNVPLAGFKPFTKDESDALSKVARDGTADETLSVMKRIASLGGDVAKAGFKQIGEKDSLFGFAAQHTDGSAAADIVRGEKLMKTDKDIVTSMGETETNRVAAFNQYVGKAIGASGDATTIRKAADAIYVQRELTNGPAKAGAFDPTGYQRSIDAALGGAGKAAIGSVNGAQMHLPAGLSADTFSTALKRMTDVDYAQVSKWGGSPHYADGTVAKASDIAHEGKFEAIGAGEYVVKMADGKQLVSGTSNGRLVAYIFRLDPVAIAEFAARIPHIAPVPGVTVRGVVPPVPATPRVIGQ